MSRKHKTRKNRGNGTPGPGPIDATSRAPAAPGGARDGAPGGAQGGARGNALRRAVSAPRSRRRALTWIGGLGLASLGAVVLARHDARTRELHDLSVIGDGAPVVVQVHDPSCPMCRRLMGTTRDTLEGMPRIRYRIADLTSADGRTFADGYRVGKVTLLLFDARGRHVDTVQGVTPAETLRRLFEERFARFV